MKFADYRNDETIQKMFDIQNEIDITEMELAGYNGPISFDYTELLKEHLVTLHKNKLECIEILKRK